MKKVVKETVEELLSFARTINRLVRGGKEELQPESEARRKLFTTDPKKPGELVELIQTLERNGERWDVADECADVLYYCCQIDNEEWTLVDQFSFAVQLCGFTGEEIAQCALVKYGRRARTNTKDKTAERKLVRERVEKFPLRETDNKAAIEELWRILQEAE